MASKKVYFADAEKMRQGFEKMIAENPSLVGEKIFFDFLLGCAGQETHVQHIVLIIIMSIEQLIPARRISLYRIAEALLDDEETIKLVKESLERIALQTKTRQAAR